MMVSPKICKMCMYKRWRDQDISDKSRKALMQQLKQNLKRNVFWCPKRAAEKKVVVDDEKRPPEDCFYYMEQLLATQKELEVA